MRYLVAFVVSAVVTLCRGGDFATLKVTTSGDGHLTTTLHGAHSVSGELPVKLDFNFGDVILADSERCEAENETASEVAHVVFDDDGVGTVAPLASYTLRARLRKCTQRESDEATLGMKTSQSPVWKIWTYASFAKDEIRLGREHPKNAHTLGAEREGKFGLATPIRCDGGFEERMCLIRNATIDGFSKVTFDVDFQASTNRVLVPQDVFLHYTSVSSVAPAQCANWPPLTIRTPKPGNAIRIRAALLVRHSDLTEPDECVRMSEALRTSGVLVAHDDDQHTILLGNSVLHDYTFERDYLQSTMYTRLVLATDHFSLLEMILFMFVFTLYIYYKTDPTDRTGSFLIGQMPLCSVCKRPYVRACSRHYTRLALIVNATCVAALFGVAWYTFGMSSRVGVGFDETDLIVWSAVSLGVATIECAAYAIAMCVLMRSATTSATNMQHWEMVGIASVKAACSVALFSLSSVVRGDDLTSLLTFFIALFITYDSMRRFVEDVFALPVTFSRRRAPAWRVLWPLRTLTVSGGLNAGFTTYVMTRHVIYSTLLSKTFTAIFLVICAYFSVLLNVVCMRRAIRLHAQNSLVEEK